jgi:hypothetical protein
MNETKYFCDLCKGECSKYELFDIDLQLTERTNSNLQGDRTIVTKEICRSCLEKEGIIPTNKTTHCEFGLNKYEREKGLRSVIELIKKVFK